MDINVANRNGETPLIMAARVKLSKELIKLLLKMGADLGQG